MDQSDLQKVYAFMAQNPPAPGSSIIDLRANAEARAQKLALDEGSRIEPANIGTPIPSEWHIGQDAADDKAILYAHGGAFRAGSPVMRRSLGTRLSEQSGMRVLAIGYRLAPEHPFPAGLDDAVAAYRFLLDQGYVPEKIAVAGDSAGGGLAISMLVLLKELGLPQPAVAAVFSPWVNLLNDGESYDSVKPVDNSLPRELMHDLAKQYLGGTALRDPRASPVFADLTGLPPLLIQVGDSERLRSDSEQLHEAATVHDMECYLEIWSHMFHVFQAYWSILPDGREALDRVGNFFRERTK